MTATIDILKGELERLFSLEELTNISTRMLGLDPKQVGGATAKGSFAKALTEHCVEGDRIEALVDVILVSRTEVDPRVRDIAGLIGGDELTPGTEIGGYKVERKVGASDLGVVYIADRGGKKFTLKTLRREAARDRRAVHRFLTANRLVGTVKNPGLPASIDAGELRDGLYYVAYEHIEAEPLTNRLRRTGPLHLSDLRPLLRAALEPLAALHKAHLVHGDLKLDHVLVQEGKDLPPKAFLIDFGGDRLRPRLATMKGSTGFLAVFGSPKTIAPEQVRGIGSDSRTDVYSFGAMVYELLTGKPVFPVDNPTDAAFHHLAQIPEPPSAKAPRGFVSREVDEWVLAMLHKDPSQRPRDAGQILAQLDRFGTLSKEATGAQIPRERVDQLVNGLTANPSDGELAMALEKAIDQGADRVGVADAFVRAAAFQPADRDQWEVKKSLLFRAARTLEGASEKERAEEIYLQIIAADPADEVATAALESVRKALGKYEELVEMLLQRSEAARPGEERARIMSEIARLCGGELDDAEQALVAYTQALGEVPTDSAYADEVERLAGSDQARWTEIAENLSESAKSEHLSATEKNALLDRIGRIYDTRLSRADMAVMAFQQILSTDPANDSAYEGLSAIYRRAQQWPELVSILLARSDAASATPRARDFRAEAAEVLETKLSDPMRAKEIYQTILADDPGHLRAGDQVATILERMGDFQSLVQLLEQRAEARRGPEKADAFARVAEVYEDHLNDLTTATQRYEQALAVDHSNLAALKGLDRILNRTGRYSELLGVLERQIAVAATPRQKINLFERVAALYDEEFLDHERAAESLESILRLDPTNDSAMTSVARHYRALNRWEDLAELLERHANGVADDPRRVEILINRARVVSEQIGSPDRATKIYEQILQLSPGNASALEAIAQLRELSGDANAALSALEALAEKAATPEGKAEQWMRAGRLLESRGDRDGAIERYKLAQEANPKDAQASAALRQAYLHRGELASVLRLIEKDLETTDGNLGKARLHAEMARLHVRLEDAPKATASAKRSLELDPTNAEAHLVLGDAAYDRKHFVEAQREYEQIVGRTGVLAKEDAVRALIRFVESVGKAAASATEGQATPSQSVPNPKMAVAVEALRQVAPSDPESLGQVAHVVLTHGDPTTARKMFEDLLGKHSKHMKAQERAEALYGLGESMRRSGAVDESVTSLREAANIDPSNSRALAALAKVYETKENWPEVLRMKKRRLDMATADERFDLLVEIGDVFFHKLGDRSMALKTYAAALEERPEDRNLLTRLMQLYTEEKDWQKLVDVVLRLADFVKDQKQRAKYMQTAAIVTARQLNRPDNALDFYERAIEYDPTLGKAIEDALEIRRAKNQHFDVERLLKIQLEQAKVEHDRPKLARTLSELGTLYRQFLNEPELAIDALEAAQAFDPDDKACMETLAELYALDPAQYLDKAVRAQAQLLQKNPYRVESYKLLRKLYTDAKKADGAWCLSQALAVLNLAEPDEERFYKRFKAENAAPAQAAFAEEDWTKISHEDLDPLLTRLFATIQPTIIRARTQPIEQSGYDPRYAIDVAQHPYPASQTLYYAAGVLGAAPPPVFQNPNDPGAFGMIHARTPSIVLGRAAFENQFGTQALAFVIGRHLAAFRTGFYVRHLVPTGTGLKAWLFAAIRHSTPQFPVAPDLVGPVTEALQFIQQDFQGPQKDRLASQVSKLMQAGGALDLKKWVGAVDLTTDRVGFVLAHDLDTTTEAIRSTESDSSVGVKERLKEVVLYSVSEEYIALREKLQIGVVTG